MNFQYYDDVDQSYKEIQKDLPEPIDEDYSKAYRELAYKQLVVSINCNNELNASDLFCHNFDTHEEICDYLDKFIAFHIKNIEIVKKKRLPNIMIIRCLKLYNIEKIILKLCDLTDFTLIMIIDRDIINLKKNRHDTDNLRHATSIDSDKFIKWLYKEI